MERDGRTSHILSAERKCAKSSESLVRSQSMEDEEEEEDNGILEESSVSLSFSASLDSSYLQTLHLTPTKRIFLEQTLHVDNLIRFVHLRTRQTRRTSVVVVEHSGTMTRRPTTNVEEDVTPVNEYREGEREGTSTEREGACRDETRRNQLKRQYKHSIDLVCTNLCCILCAIR